MHTYVPETVALQELSQANVISFVVVHSNDAIVDKEDACTVR